MWTVQLLKRLQQHWIHLMWNTHVKRQSLWLVRKRIVVITRPRPPTSRHRQRTKCSHSNHIPIICNIYKINNNKVMPFYANIKQQPSRILHQNPTCGSGIYLSGTISCHLWRTMFSIPWNLREAKGFERSRCRVIPKLQDNSDLSVLWNFNVR